MRLPSRDIYAALKKGSGTQEVATTMATVRTFKEVLRDKEVGPRIVPIIPDEARTFGMDSWFPSLKIYNRNGQLYTAVDADLMLAYKEAKSATSCTRASTRPGRWGRSSRPAPRMRRTTSR